MEKSLVCLRKALARNFVNSLTLPVLTLELSFVLQNSEATTLMFPIDEDADSDILNNMLSFVRVL